MASSPETAPTTPSDQSPPPTAAETPPPEAPSPPTPTANETPPQSPPPASTTPSPPAPPPPSEATAPPNSQSQSPPSDSSGSNEPPSSDSPPRSRDSPSRGYSPPSPGDGDSESDSPTSRSGGRSSDSGSSSNGRDNSPSSSGSVNSGVVAAIVVAGIVIIALLVVCLICSRRKKKRPQYYIDPGQKGGNQYYNAPPQWNSPKPDDHAVKVHPPPPGGGSWGTTPTPPPANNSGDYTSGYSGPRHTPMPPPSPNFGSQSQFSYEDLAYATGGFAQENLLGQGGFGYVHKGFLPGGKVVAVKSLKSGSGQGEREFTAEVEIISRVHHRHLVSLVGYCIADGHTMLVYDFVPNQTMEFHLHGKGQPVMDWSTRLRIALGSAKGLAYLHEDCHPRIIHRDIKAANILIDNNFEAMVADFGLAKLTTDNNTHVSTRVMGTFGYLAPEYASSGKLTEKSDVFSFGVMLLELITGRRPVDPYNTMEDSLVDWARPLLARAQEEGIYDELVDPRLEDKFNHREMDRMVACAAASIRHSARRRPRMGQIVRALEGDSSLDDLNETGKAGQGGAISKPNTEIYDTRAYDADMMKFRQMVMMPSQDFNSSEYGGTSEYGLNPSSTSSSNRPSPDLRRPSYTVE